MNRAGSPLRPNYGQERDRASLPVLNDDQAQAIHSASLDVLEHTGYHVPVEEARKLLVRAGAIADGERVRIPGELVEQALQTVRSPQIYNRRGELTSLLTPGKVTFGSMVDTLNIIDPYLHTQRNFTLADQGLCARLLDALPNIDYVQVIGQSMDVPDPVQSQVAVAQTLRYTTKPVLVYPYDLTGLMDVIDLVQAVAGSADAFREKPFLMCASVPPGLLYGSDYNLELLLTSAAYEIPLLYYSTPALGANSPCSVAGMLVLMNADWLANLVIHQLKRAWCAVLRRGSHGAIDGHAHHALVVLRSRDADGIRGASRPGSLVRLARLWTGNDQRYPCHRRPGGRRDVCPGALGVSQRSRDGT